MIIEEERYCQEMLMKLRSLYYITINFPLLEYVEDME